MKNHSVVTNDFRLEGKVCKIVLAQNVDSGKGAPQRGCSRQNSLSLRRFRDTVCVLREV